MNLKALDRLRVFVSSTIGECAAERSVAKKAIRSLNFEPILFEDVGARPYPPRDLYVSRLEASHVFVAIYRKSYGSVAPGMTISGIEDEFNIASRRGIDRLIYVYETDEEREPPLTDLVEHATITGVSYWKYSNPDELYERIRDDVTSVVSQRFLEQEPAVEQVPSGGDVLTSLLPNLEHRFLRAEVVNAILTTLEERRRVVVTGPLGVGKTVLLAQLSETEDWLHIDAQGISRLDLCTRIANAARQQLGQPRLTFWSEDSAREAAEEAIREGQWTLAVDSPVDFEFVWNLHLERSRLVVGCRSHTPVPQEYILEIPRLSREEIRHWVTTWRKRPPKQAELAQLDRASEGNPLYLRFYALGEPSEIDLSLRDLEVNAVRSLSARTREILSYLTLVGAPLSLADLHSLSGSDLDGPEAVASVLDEASGLIRQSSGRVGLIHEHLRMTLLQQLHRQRARLGFFASHLGKYFENSDRPLLAFSVYDEAGEVTSCEGVLDKAAHEAALRGGGAAAVRVFRRMVERARKRVGAAEEVYSLVNLSYALAQIGSRTDARNVLEAAESTAGDDEELLLRVQEGRTLLSRVPDERIAKFLALREAHALRDDPFSEVRICTQLTAEYITNDRFVEAEETARVALEYFSAAGDQYGVQLAKVNLAVALAEIDGRQREASILVRELHDAIDPGQYPRERAVLCNLLTRHYRKNRETGKAAQYAREAIGIGEELEDQHVMAINHINLGNVLRDEQMLDGALAEYELAERYASQAGFQRTEAAANRSMASILNDQEMYALAVHHAVYASALAVTVGDHKSASLAHAEHARSLVGQRDIDGATDAYITGARSAMAFQPHGPIFVSMVIGALRQCVISTRPDLTIKVLGRLFVPEYETMRQEPDGHPAAILYAALQPMATILRREKVLSLTALAMSELFRKIPHMLERRIILKAIQTIRRNPGDETAAIGVVGILLASSYSALKLDDIVTIGDGISEMIPGIHFKPYPDGASHWTVRLDVGKGVITTITQLDVSPRTATVAMMLALLLRSLSSLIATRLIEADSVSRSEVVINVVNKLELEDQVPKAGMVIGEMTGGFAVAESRSVNESEESLLIVVLDDEFPGSWNPTQTEISDVHMVFGQLLSRLAVQLFAREVEPEVLYPKVDQVIKQIAYHGRLA